MKPEELQRLDALIGKHIEDVLSEGEEQKLREALRASEEAFQYFLEMTGLHLDLGQLFAAEKAESGSIPETIRAQQQEQPARLRKHSKAVIWLRYRALPIAAAAGILLALTGYLLLSGTGDSLRGQRIVAAAAPITKELDNYCKLVLAPHSALVINGEPKARKVALEQGQVTCAVKKNVGTFAVESELGNVSVQGTEFAVNFIKEKEIAWGSQLSVRVLSGTVRFAPAWGPNVTLSDEKDAPKKGGILTGILTNEGAGAWITVLADGEEEDIKYLPRLVDGGLDQEMLSAFKRFFPYNRVRLVWAYSEPRRVLAVELLAPKERSGKVTGVVVNKVVHQSEGWIDVKPKDGPLDRYTSHSMSKDIIAALRQTQKDDTVTVEWSFLPNDCKRIETIEKAGR